MQNDISISLQPFSAHDRSLFNVRVHITRDQNVFLLRYCIDDPGNRIDVGTVSPTPKRKDNLWHHTCLELFLKQGEEAYAEYNISPEGHWNYYAFDSYRKQKKGHKHQAQPPTLYYQKDRNNTHIWEVTLIDCKI